MDERAKASIGRRYAQCAIFLLVFGPLIGYGLQVSGIPIGTYYIVLGLSLGVSLALYGYLQLRFGRDPLLRLLPDWVFKWPHKRLALFLSLSILVWYFVATVWNMGTPLYRLVYLELIVGLVLETYAYFGARRTNRSQIRTEAR